MPELIKPKVYIDTSVISYLVSEPSYNLVSAIRQQITREWWEQHRSYFDLYISEMVTKEAVRGNPEEAKKRLAIINTIQNLELNEKVTALTQKFLKKKALPTKASDDALHIAIATVHKMDGVITWNLKHIANFNIRKAMLKACKQEGYELPIVCTPEELIGE